MDVDSTAGGSASEATLTRFLMWEPNEDGTTWDLKGYQLAHDRGSAARKFYAGRDGGVGIPYCAVSENSWKPGVHVPKIVHQATTQPYAMPTPEQLAARAAGSTPDPVGAPPDHPGGYDDLTAAEVAEVLAAVGDADESGRVSAISGPNDQE